MKTLKGLVLDIIIESGKHGCMASEIYVKLKDYNPRSIRQTLYTLTNIEGIVNTELCRCGHTPIYREKKEVAIKTT